MVDHNDLSPVAEWLGAIAQTRGALQVSGDIEGGGRVTLEIPENQLGRALALAAMRGQTLRIRVEVVDA